MVKWYIGTGTGCAKNALVAFDKALLDAGVGNYNLVRLSSILPAKAISGTAGELRKEVQDGSLLPTAYSTISSDVEGETIVSTIGVGLPADKTQVGVIMEYSAKNVTCQDALETLDNMIREAFRARNWELNKIIHDCIQAKVEINGMNYTTFACISEW